VTEVCLFIFHYIFEQFSNDYLDEGWITWAQSIISAFSNSDAVLTTEDFVDENFDRSITSVTEFEERLRTMPCEAAQEKFQETLLLGFAETYHGLYSNFHDNATYAFGYDDERTIRLAHM
jgi:RNA-dependent RNA polymerase